jgi:threonyl-tRNA synthetase
MNCPHHCEIYKASPKSYKDLPVRYAEFGTVYRYEQAGELHGLTRVRGFTQDDAHLFCRPDQVKEEFCKVIDLVLYVIKALDFKEFTAQISLRDPENKTKYIGSDENWALAESAIIESAAEKGLNTVIELGEAAFYGPKISVQAKDAIGRTWQMSTIQVDFQLPQRFELEYSAADGTRQRPVMIHRALFGSIERFFGVLTEHYAGAFPPWLAPLQAVGIPVADAFADYLADVISQMKKAGIRAELDSSDDRMQKKVRNAQMQKIPFMVIAGEEDQKAGAVSFRYRNGEQKNGIPIADAIKEIKEAVTKRIQV